MASATPCVPFNFFFSNRSVRKGKFVSKPFDIKRPKDDDDNDDDDVDNDADESEMRSP